MRISRMLWMATAGAAAITAGCEKVTFPTPQPQERFQATLNGANEVPAVTAPGSGAAIFAVTLDTFLAFRVDVATLDSAIAAHIHAGAAGVPGGVIVTLFTPPTACRNANNEPINATSPRCTPAYTGALTQGQLTPSQLTSTAIQSYGATPRARFDSLLALMRNGNVYVNVHTVAFTGGHIRGQIQP